jgi:hypothetical protein
VHGDPLEIGDHVVPAEAHQTAMLLLRHGGALTAAGKAIWPLFVGLLEERGGLTIPDHLRNPPTKRVIPIMWRSKYLLS